MPTVDWPNKIIHVGRNEMILIQASPTEIRQLDMDWFRLALRDLEDDPAGMPWPRTHNHNTTVEVSGAVLARVVQIVNGYTVTFEDGQYAVNIVGANTNVGDVTNVNQVSVRTSNSAGLQDLNSLQAASFDGEVAFAPSSQYSGTTFPVGTRAFPVNNLQDAHDIALARGIRTIAVMETAIFDSGHFSEGFTFRGDNPVAVTITLEPAIDVTNCEFVNARVQGMLDGSNIFHDCIIGDVTYLNGFIYRCALEGTITIGGGQLSILDCWSNVAGGGPGQYPTIDMGGAGNQLALRGYDGGLAITNSSGVATSSLDFDSGRCVFESSVTGGEFTVRGVCDVEDNSVGGIIYDLTITEMTDTVRKVTLNRLETDPVTGKMRIYDDDDATVAYESDVFEDVSGTQVYRGRGIERRNRLTPP